MDAREADDFFLLHPSKLAEPWEDFCYFREQYPLFFHPSVGQWFIFRFDDVSALFRDPRLSAKRINALEGQIPPEARADAAPILTTFRNMFLMMDPPAHRSLRGIAHQAFNAGRINAMRKKIAAAANGLLDAVADQPSFDVATDFAHKLPVMLACDLFGVPAHEHHLFQTWSDALGDFMNSMPITTERTRAAAEATRDMNAYLDAMIASRREQPTDDLLSDLIRAEDHDGHRMTHEQLLSTSLLILVAAHETSRNLIGSAVSLLLTHPQALAMWRAEPERLHNVIEETLRVQPPHPMMSRVVAEDFSYQGAEFRAGQFVELVIGSANRDEAHFSESDRYDITREKIHHLSFGDGVHSCLGAALARLLAAEALPALFGRLPALRLDPARPAVWQTLANLRGPVSLPVLV